MNTDLSGCKRIASALFDAEMNVIPEYGIVQHPWISSTVCSYLKDGKPVFIHIDDEDFMEACRTRMNIQLESCNSVSSICLYLNKPYRLTYLYLCYKYKMIGPEELGVCLQDVWSSVENISQDCNVTSANLASMFRYAKKHCLMDESEIEYLQSAPDMITLYRGVTSINNKEVFAMSWTDKYGTAAWFAKRWSPNSPGEIWKIIVPKSCILAYYNNRNESEFVVDTLSVDPNILMDRTIEYV